MLEGFTGRKDITDLSLTEFIKQGMARSFSFEHVIDLTLFENIQVAVRQRKAMGLNAFRPALDQVDQNL
jgi:ABC-type uncharacterized transport system ATPase subunit